MTLFFVLVVVATLNLALGYALAVHMGYGPGMHHETCNMFSAGGLSGLASGKSVDALIEELTSEPASLTDPKPAAQEPSKPEESPPAETVIEGLVLAFRGELVKNEESLIRIEAELRSPQDPTETMIEAHTLALQSSCEAYLGELREASERLQSWLKDSDALATLREQIDLALVEQLTQVDATIRNLGQMDLASDPTMATAKLTEVVASLVGTIHQLRDYLDMACVTIVRQENRLNTIDDRFGTDPMTNLPNRLGLEHLLQQWWQQGRHQSQPHSAVLFDFDRFTKINQDHGVSAGNQVLRVVAERMRSCLGPDDLIVRYSGQRIAVLLSGVESADAMQAAERVRQAAQADSIPCGEMAIPISLSGGIVEILPHDTPQDVLDRLEKALNESRRAGPGQLLLYKGETSAGGDDGLSTKDEGLNTKD